MILYQGQPDIVSAALYTTDRKITSFTVIAANLSGTDTSFRLNHCQDGAAENNSNIIVPDLVVVANNLTVIDMALELQLGDVIRGLQSDAGTITLTIDGTDGT